MTPMLSKMEKCHEKADTKTSLGANLTKNVHLRANLKILSKAS